MSDPEFVYLGFVGCGGNLGHAEQTAFMRTCRHVTYNRFARLLRRHNLRALDNAMTTPVRLDGMARFAVGRWNNNKAVCLMTGAAQHYWIKQNI